MLSALAVSEVGILGTFSHSPVLRGWNLLLLDKDDGSVETTYWAIQCRFWLFLFCIMLCWFSMLAGFIVGKFFSVALFVLDVIKIVDGIKGCDFSFMS